MTELELKELIEKIQGQKAETQSIELKRASGGCPKKLYDSLSAFSNQDDGGIILFGIDESENFSITGVYDPQDLQKHVNEQCKQMIPVIRPVFTVLILDGKTVVSAEIPGIDISDRPCYYGGVGRIKGSYIRVGDSDEPMSEYEIYSYEAFRKKYEDDIRITEQAELKVIDMTSLAAYLERIKMNNPKLSKLDDKDIYRFLNMIIDSKPTLACTLLFSIYPQMFYPQYTINAMVVMGYEKGDIGADGARFIDNRRIEGTIEDMLNESIRFLTKNMKVETIIDSASGKRMDRTEYPIVVLREVVLNALIHRDYSIHTQSMPIEIVMYKDRLEIKNPGGLYGRLTIDKLGKVQPDTRNPALARAMETIGLTENRYSGIPTIIREMKETNMKAPIFMNSRREFKVVLYNRSTEQIFGQGVIEEEPKTQELRLLEFCKEPRSRKEISDFLGVATVNWMMKNYINPLIESGKLTMTKPDVPKSKNQKYYSLI
jgi:ATP-dependent DNA helicase RecG